MDKVNGKLTVYYDDPFWVGIFERSEGSRLSNSSINRIKRITKSGTVKKTPPKNRDCSKSSSRRKR